MPVGLDSILFLPDEKFAPGQPARLGNCLLDGIGILWDFTTIIRQIVAPCNSRVDADQENLRILFTGDSLKDEPMFGYYENSVAAGNFSVFREGVRELPHWLTQGSVGAGFVEVAGALLEARDSL